MGLRISNKLLALVISVTYVADLYAAEYTVTQIGNTAFVNREPVISDSGLIAWFSHGEDLPDDGGGSDIYIYRDGKTTCITKELGHYIFAGNMRPRVYNDIVTWQTTRDQFGIDREYTWKVKEVPDEIRDAGEYPETPAFYRSQLPEGIGDQNSNIHLEPEKQLHSGPYSNEFQWITSRIKNFYSHPKTNTVDDLNADDTEEIDPRELAAKPPLDDVEEPEENMARRGATGLNEIYRWDEESGIQHITHDGHNDLGPDRHGELTTWQKAKSFPFGWEIMVYDESIDERYQITTNFYYDMAPKAYGRQVVWYGWDGNDYEIYLWDADSLKTKQITDNEYDDVSPVIYEDALAWEAYPGIESEIYYWSESSGKIQKLSNNYEDDINPRIHKNSVVWQGYDGDDFEIYLFDGSTVTKLTSNNYDDIQPDIHGDTIVWMGYHQNWDAEIFVNETAGKGDHSMITDNEFEDKDPRTALGKIVWQSDNEELSEIFYAEPN